MFSEPKMMMMIPISRVLTATNSERSRSLIRFPKNPLFTMRATPMTINATLPANSLTNCLTALSDMGFPHHRLYIKLSSHRGSNRLSTHAVFRFRKGAVFRTFPQHTNAFLCDCVSSYLSVASNTTHCEPMWTG